MENLLKNTTALARAVLENYYRRVQKIRGQEWAAHRCGSDLRKRARRALACRSMRQGVRF